jgi:hypothetical protein
MHISLISFVRPIVTVVIFNRTLSKARDLVERCKGKKELAHIVFSSFDFSNRDFVNEHVALADIIVTATSSTMPLFDGAFEFSQFFSFLRFIFEAWHSFELHRIFYVSISMFISFVAQTWPKLIQLP